MYKPNKLTEAKIPEIEESYYNDKLSITQISKKLDMDFETVSNVLVYCLHGKLTRSESSKYVFKNLTEEQKSNFLNAAIEKRKNDPIYIKKLSETKLGIKNPSSKLNEEQVKDVRKIYKELLNKGYKKTESQYIIAEKFGVKRSTISDIVLSKTWKHIS